MKRSFDTENSIDRGRHDAKKSGRYAAICRRAALVIRAQTTHKTRIRAAILIVDDHPANLLALEAVLGPLGHRVVSASSGEEALAAVAADDFALVLLDVMMPGLDGFDTAARMRKESKRPTPIIFLTALDRGMADFKRGYAQGAVDYLVKPVDADVLRAKVAVFVELYTSRIAREQAEANERSYRFVADSIPQQVWTARPSGELDYVNSVVMGYFAKSAAEILAAGWQELIHPDDATQALERWHRSLATGEPYDVELRLRRHDGAYRWHLGRGLPVREASGALSRWFGTHTDVHDAKVNAEQEAARKAAESGEERVRQIVESISDPMLILDARGVVSYVNEQGAALFDVPRAAIAGWNLWESFPALRDGKLHTSCLRAGEELRPISFEDYWPTSGQWFDVRVYPTRDGRISAHFRDVSEQKVLAAREAERSRELARSNEELERFAYVASHDLQEPLRMVASYTQLLGRRYKGKLDASADEFIAFAVDGANRMQALINGLLSFSRVGTRAAAFTPVSLEVPLQAALANLRAAITESGAEIAHGALPTLPVDQGQMLQLFQNLIGNAMKFRGPRAPKVEVGAAQENGAWHFWVADNGIGIDPAFFDRLFVLFQRLHTRTEYQGNGIGLAICKKIVERHGGRIWVESTPGAGTTFHFTLPVPAR